MATPHIAGAMALLWCARPELRHNISASRTALNEAAYFIAYKQCGSPVLQTMLLAGGGSMRLPQLYRPRRNVRFHVESRGRKARTSMP